MATNSQPPLAANNPGLPSNTISGTSFVANTQNQRGALGKGFTFSPNFVHDFAGFGHQEVTVVCVICGVICRPTVRTVALGEGVPGSHWLRPVLLTAKPNDWNLQNLAEPAARRVDDDLLEAINVIQFNGGALGMESYGPIATHGLELSTSSDRINIPLHRACLDIAKRLCKFQARFGNSFRAPDGGTPATLAHLYEIWCKRAIAGNQLWGGLLRKPIPDPFNYLGVPTPNTLEGYSKFLSTYPDSHIILSNPTVVPGLTSFITRKLTTMDGKPACIRSDLVQIERRLRTVPQEIYDMILNYLEPFDDGLGVSLTCSRLFTPRWWKDELFKGHLIPWLWDLQPAELKALRISEYYFHDRTFLQQDQDNGTLIFDESMWDWELLCRQLAQPDVFEKGGILYGSHPALRNRWRIWQLLSKARLGHVCFDGI
ncbi:hypothetical protein F5Y16DRAFT_424668 [Xylariaceae sp. FL0255]|nr:hypothetical protein F5Y16DRAFT_424668 [Xylariaceae sp. FL0255]